MRHLLSHTSGIVSTTALGPKFWGAIQDERTPAQLIALLAEEPLHFAPGRKYEYSNTNYLLLSMLVPDRRRVCEKAGLEHTFVCEAEPLLQNRAAGYELEKHQLQNAHFISMSNARGAGDLCSTAPDPRDT